jgi:hypothetical protein
MRYQFLFPLAFAALLASCASKDKDNTPAPQPAISQGYLRIVNNLSEAPTSRVSQGPIQLQVDGKLLGPEAAVATAAPYQPVVVGEHQVQIMLPSASGLHYIYFSKLPVAKDQYYSLYTFTGGVAGSELAKVVTEDATLPVPAAGKVQVRLLNLSPQQIPVRLEEPTAAAPLYASVAAGDITPYQSLDARTYNLLATRTNGTQAPLFTQAVTLTAGKVYTLVLRGTDYPFAVAPEKLALDVVADN